MLILIKLFGEYMVWFKEYLKELMENELDMYLDDVRGCCSLDDAKRDYNHIRKNLTKIKKEIREGSFSASEIKEFQSMLNEVEKKMSFWRRCINKRESITYFK